MKIVADDKIPFLKGVLEPLAEVVYLPGQMVNNSHIRDADALLVRTRTQCNEDLLKGSRVKFIGTATIGYDHIDTSWCEKQGITWKNAPGCNASSVSQYIASALLTLSVKLGFSLKDRSLGVVGVGNVGSKVVRFAELIGMQVYLCDPPRVRQEGACGFIAHDGILRECDLISYHVPLNLGGKDKTYQMINSNFLENANKGTIIINTSRGEVADGNALKDAMRKGTIAGLVLDVWENEPAIDTELMRLCSLATPHIAGYSADGKAKGTSMVVQELSRFFKLGVDDWEAGNIPHPPVPEIRIDCRNLSTDEILYRAILHTYAVTGDDSRLREAPERFEKLRCDYPLRREFTAYTLLLEHASEDQKRLCRKLGFKVKHQ